MVKEEGYKSLFILAVVKGSPFHKVIETHMEWHGIQQYNYNI